MFCVEISGRGGHSWGGSCSERRKTLTVSNKTRTNVAQFQNYHITVG